MAGKQGARVLRFGKPAAVTDKNDIVLERLAGRAPVVDDIDFLKLLRLVRNSNCSSPVTNSQYSSSR